MKVEIKNNTGTGCGTQIFINGENVSASISRLVLTIDANEYVKLELSGFNRDETGRLKLVRDADGNLELETYNRTYFGDPVCASINALRTSDATQ